MGNKTKSNLGMFNYENDYWGNKFENSCDYMLYLNKLTEISVGSFNWKGLPDTIDKRFLELCLFFDGYCTFFYDEDMCEYYALRSALGGTFNVYNIPNQRNVFAPNGYHRTLNQKNSVIIYNNYMHTPSAIPCIHYSKQLYEIDRTINVNVNAQKTPVLLTCDSKQKLTLLNLYKRYKDNEPVIYGTSDLDTNSVKSISTNAEYKGDILYDLKTNIWNEALTTLGITNISIQKKERLIVDEVERSQGGTLASRYSRVEARQNACEEINRMFKLNVSCEFREDGGGSGE